MRPFPTHALTSEKPRPCRTTATGRPDASAFPSIVSPPLPKNGLHSLQARKVKAGKGKEKQRGEHFSQRLPLPNQSLRIGKKRTKRCWPQE